MIKYEDLCVGDIIRCPDGCVLFEYVEDINNNYRVSRVGTSEENFTVIKLDTIFNTVLASDGFFMLANSCNKTLNFELISRV
jgi:hypothetical protein